VSDLFSTPPEADSNALRVAMDAHQAFEFVGMPEGRIPFAHAILYLATAP